MKKQWYGVRSFIRWAALTEDAPGQHFEERVVILRAASPKEALRKGRAEAKDYAKGRPRTKVIPHFVALATWETELAEGEEVWSCFRRSNLSAEAFLERYLKDERIGNRHFDG